MVKSTNSRNDNIELMDAAKLRDLIHEERRFYGMIVHEIRTQVGIVSNLSEMLIDESLANSHEFYKKALQQTSERIVHLSQSFLEIDQFRKNEIQLKIEAVELASFMEIFVMPYAHMAANKGLLLKLLVEEKCPKFIKTDVVRLGQILSNLIENAIKYTEKGQVQIHVYYDAEAQIPLIFDVIDSGIGLGFDDEAARAKIFSEYARLDNALDQEGVGLGLWIIRTLAQNMGGDISVARNHPQNVSGGSCFRLRLPLQIDKNFKPSSSNLATKPFVLKRSAISEVVKVEKVPQNVKREGRILLVEDNRLNQHIIGTMLDSAGFDFDIAASLTEAKYMIKPHKYVLILLDLNLPDGRGEDLVRKFGDEKVLALTADIGDDLEQQLIELGFEGLIEKPIVTKDFFNKIYGILAVKDV